MESLRPPFCQLVFQAVSQARGDSAPSMGHSTRGPEQGGPEEALGWALAEGEAFLRVPPEPDSGSHCSAFSGYLTLRPSWPLHRPGILLLWLEGGLLGLPEVATEGCGFLLGQVGLRPVGKLKV